MLLQISSSFVRQLSGYGFYERNIQSGRLTLFHRFPAQPIIQPNPGTDFRDRSNIPVSARV
jgi:hypothetical protein